MKTLITLFALVPTLCFGQWTQLGNHIEGTQSSGRLGRSVSIDGTGQNISVGLPNKANSNGDNTGQVQVYELQGATWALKGNSMSGINGGDNFGDDIKLSDNGNVVAIGAPGFTTSPTTNGFAAVYEFNGSNWIQRGLDLIGSSTDDSYGTAVSLSSDGSIVAVAAEPFVRASYIRVFQWNGTSWNQLGSDISTGMPGDGFGRWINLDSNGTTLVASAVNHDSPLTDIGRAMVFEWNGSNWVQKGSDLIGDGEDDFFGAGVALNGDGNTLVVGARDDVFNMSRGYVKIFDWNGTSWIQKGSNLIGAQGGDFFGDVNDINSSGDIIVSGTVLGNYAKIHQFQGTEWVELDSISVTGGIQFGTAVGMNNSGSQVIIGDFSNLVGNLNAAGRATVFENNTILSMQNLGDLVNISIFPNPASHFIRVESEQNIKAYRISSIEGKLIQNETTFNQHNFNIDIHGLRNGIYVLELISDKDKKSMKLIKE